MNPTTKILTRFLQNEIFVLEQMISKKLFDQPPWNFKQPYKKNY